MQENFSIPYNYKEGTFRAEEITDFSGETIDVEYGNCGLMYRYNVPKYNREVLIYSNTLNDNPVVTVTYDGDGIIKYMELQRNNSTELMYINFHDNEHAKETVYKYSGYLGDWISEKILERKEKIARLFIIHFYDGDAVDFIVNTYTPEDVQKVIDDYNRYIETKGEKYKLRNYHAEDNCGNYYHDNEIIPDIENLRIMLLCADENFCGELYEFAVSSITERIKNNVLDKIDKAENFKLISEECD
ncbi:MAG: hypothetical protein K2H26_02135 [Ruminococcus sp.]|nr:hypothetical protein [Ruminococcus sp.]